MFKITVIEKSGEPSTYREASLEDGALRALLAAAEVGLETHDRDGLSVWGISGDEADAALAAVALLRTALA